MTEAKNNRRSDIIELIELIKALSDIRYYFSIRMTNQILIEGSISITLIIFLTKIEVRLQLSGVNEYPPRLNVSDF